MTDPTRAAIYARISLDRSDGEGVARQLADCRHLCAERGWQVVGEYVDNDMSAYRAKRRPEWLRLLADLDAGVFDILVAYHPDRTYRSAVDLEALIDIVERTGAEVATVKAGDVDLATATGRMGARIVAAVNRHESERIGERVSRAKRERAAQGRPPGGGLRAFGYQPDKVTLVPKEAGAIRGAAERVAAGGSMGVEAQRLNAAGFTTTAGKPWDVASLRRVLTSPRIAGLRAYKGEIVGPAVWPAIIDEDTWRRLVAMVEGRRSGRRSSTTTLLSALIGCPHCGGRLYASTKRNGITYACAPSTRRGCGRSSIAAHHADPAVSEKVEAWLDDPTFLRHLATRPVTGDELDAIDARLIALAQRWARGDMGDDEYDAARTVLKARRDALDEPVVARPADMGLLLGAWRNGSVGQRRVVIEAVVALPIGLRPGRHTHPGDRLVVEFRDT